MSAVLGIEEILNESGRAGPLMMGRNLNSAGYTYG